MAGFHGSIPRGRGQGGHAALTAKYQTGPWLFAAAGFGGAGSFGTSRVITLPSFGSVAKGSPTTAQLGVLLRDHPLLAVYEKSPAPVARRGVE